MTQLLFTVARLRDLSPLEVHQLYKQRVDIFVHEQQCPYAEIDDQDAADETLHILARAADTRDIVGTARVFGHHIGRVTVAKQMRGTGVGADLMHEALAVVADTSGPGTVEIEAQVQALPFYEKVGFTAVGEVFDLDGVPHKKMTLQQ